MEKRLNKEIKPATPHEIIAEQMKPWLESLYKNGLDRAYPMNPLGVKARISSGYGHRNAPEGTANHEAIDLVPADPKLRENVPVYAAVAGRVLYVGKPDEGSGYTVFVGGDNGKIYSYAHLEKGSAKVRIGERVERGEALAVMGNTGNVTTLPDGTKLKCLHFVERSIMMEGERTPPKQDRTNYDVWLWANSKSGTLTTIPGPVFKDMVEHLPHPFNSLSKDTSEKVPPRIFFNVDPRKAEFIRANEPKDYDPPPPGSHIKADPKSPVVHKPHEDSWGEWVAHGIGHLLPDSIRPDWMTHPAEPSPRLNVPIPPATGQGPKGRQH